MNLIIDQIVFYLIYGKHIVHGCIAVKRYILMIKMAAVLSILKYVEDVNYSFSSLRVQSINQRSNSLTINLEIISLIIHKYDQEKFQS